MTFIEKDDLSVFGLKRKISLLYFQDQFYSFERNQHFDLKLFLQDSFDSISQGRRVAELKD